jgi:hypothetical protein
MAEINRPGFKFPDEIETDKDNAGSDISIEIIDDTPPQDRGRDPLPQDVVKELEADDLEEYSDKVKKRLGQMKKVWHDERREKEHMSREREEALRVAQLAVEENKQLKQRLGNGERIFVQEVTKSANTELNAAKERMRQAYEAGDANLIADAQEAMTDAKLKLKDYERFQPSLQNQNNSVEQQLTQAQAPRPVVDHKAESWRQQNTWFGADEEMTSLALGLHERLVRSGVDPRSDEYYKQVDETMKRRFPEKFEDSAPQTREQSKSAPRKTANVVAPATRSTAPNRVRLTQTQVALAKKFGLTPEQYARELIKLEN